MFTEKLQAHIAETLVLEEEIQSSDKFHYQAREAHHELGLRVETRTTELKNALKQLQAEIVEHQQTKQQLSQKTSELEAVLKVLPHLYFRLDADGVILDYKPGKIENLHNLQGVVPGKQILEFLPHTLKVQFQQAITQVLQTKSLVSFQYTLPLLKGNGNFEARLSPLQEQQIIVLVREISHSEAKFRAIAQREALLNRLSSQIRASLELNCILETAVQEICNLFQIDRCAFFWYRQNTDSPYWECVYEAKSPILPCLLTDRVISTEIELIAVKALHKEVIRIDDVNTVNDPIAQQVLGDFGFTAFMSLPIHTQSGEIGAFSCGYCHGFRPWLDDEVELLQAVTDQIAIAIDQAKLYTQTRITAQTAQDKAQQLEAALLELQQTQAQLIQTEKMSSLGQLVAGIAHEINNPVSFIYGNITHASQYVRDLLHLIELYQQHYCPPIPEIHEQIYAIDLDFLSQDLPKILDSMSIGAKRIQQIVLSLRNFSRLDEDGMKPVDIHEGIDSTLLLLQNRLKAKPGQPEIQVIQEYGNLPQVMCHAGQMNQVFMNLLTNAIDALEEGVGKEFSQPLIPNTQSPIPQIRIRTELTADELVTIRITDNGPGMTEKVSKSLFDPFFTTKPVGRGTGMGLSISYQIVVKKHCGQLQCFSAPEAGAEFVITIPLQQALEE
ncbi:ATP-binding protein [Dendronalium sp. ChiSLP03b]|uniref:GAF domain-containing sensor histidine kinase n=1 Tax=Dendronalium sp. ChiSLP03b TaxID=3075381 RepID=UPI002AD3805B|nr:ATP-binding protein [Dendronalium sp. ChiSLP03b]MDZ8204458.1 ATP-binding protein [Dendronalium sp. ChiSLP03b]